MKFVYGTRLSENKFIDDLGRLICTNVRIARDGYQDYLGVEINKQNDYNVYKVLRPTSEVYNDVTIQSFENAPITYTHPSEMVNIDNYNDYSKGFCRDVRKESENGVNYLVADLVITDKELINKIQNKEVEEISCGYSAMLKDNNGEYIQTEIIGNHVAVVAKGRAETTKIIDSKGGKLMNLFKKKITKTEVIEEVPFNDAEFEEKEVEKTEVKDEQVIVLDSELIALFNENKDLFIDMCKKMKDADKDEEEKEEMKDSEEKEEEKEEKKEVKDSAIETFAQPILMNKQSFADMRSEYRARQELLAKQYQRGGNK